MLGLERIGVQSRLILLMLLVSLGSIAVIGWIGYQSARTAITAAVQNQLQSVRHSKTSGLAAMLGAVRDQVISLSDGKLAVEAMKALRDSYHAAEEKRLTSAQEDDLQDAYSTGYIRQLRDKLGGSPQTGQYLPKAPHQRYLQYHYGVRSYGSQSQDGDDLADAPADAPAGSREAVGAEGPLGDDSFYAQVHAATHERLARVASLFGFEDVLLIDDDTLEVVYTLRKRPDFATSLRDGPYAATKLATAAESLSRERDRDTFRVVDTEHYRPAGGTAVSFAMSPIFDGSEMIGILALEFPMDRIINLLSGNFQWEREGMGQTGECYLVGPDFTMRSRSRFMVEDSRAFLETLRTSPLSRSVVDQIERQCNVIGQLPVRTHAVEQALLGREGLAVVNDYRGIPVLSSYGPFDLDSLRWAVVAEMDVAEAYRPIRDYARKGLLAATALALATTCLALASSWLFMRPLKELTDAARRLGAGETDVAVNLRTRDEFGELARTFNEMAANLVVQRDELERRARENHELLLNVMPAVAVEQRLEGDERATRRFAEVTVLVAAFVGIDGLGETGTEAEAGRDVASRDSRALGQMADLVAACDEAADRCGVEKIRAVGGRYLAVCGLSVNRPDHAARAVLFAREIVQTVALFNRERGTAVVARVGVDSGPIVGGVVGRRKFRYDLWGDTLSVASHLADGDDADGRGGRPDSGVRVTQRVHDRLSDLYAFQSATEVVIRSGKPVKTWLLEA